MLKSFSIVHNDESINEVPPWRGDGYLKKRALKVVIHIEKLLKYYGKNGEIKAVNELDLDVSEGEAFVLLGPNGAGRRRLFAF